MDRDQRRHARALREEPSHEVARPLRGDHDDVDVRRRQPARQPARPSRHHAAARRRDPAADGAARPDRAAGTPARERSGRSPMRAWSCMPADELDASRAVATVRGIDPLLEPDRYPVRTAGDGPTTVTTLRVVGDIMLDRGVASARPGEHPADALDRSRVTSPGPTSRSATSRARCPTTAPPTQGDDSFAAPPDSADRLAALGFDAVSLANNHTGDYGEAALLETLDRLAAERPAALRRRPRPAPPRRPRRAGATRACGSASSASTRSARRRRPRPASPGALSIRMPPRTGPLDRVRPRARRWAPFAGWSAASTSWWCCRTGASSTPTPPGRCSARSAAAWSRPGPTSSSAATRTGCRASSTSATAPCSPTPWATSSSTWTSWSRPWRA